MKKFIISVLMFAVLSSLFTYLVFSADIEPKRWTTSFESGTPYFEGHGGPEKITVTDEAANNGKYSLLVTNRRQSWHGAALRIERIIEPYYEYEISVWVLPKNPDTSRFILSTQIIYFDGSAGARLVEKDVSSSDGWTKLTGTYVFPGRTSLMKIYIENDNPTAEFYIDDVSIKPLRRSHLPDIVKLPALKDTYEDHFLLGASVRTEHLAGANLALLKKHFSLITSMTFHSEITVTGVNRYSFGMNDYITRILNTAKLPIHGHSIIYDGTHSDYLTRKSNGTLFTRSEAIKSMTDYVNALMGRYAGKLYSIDVVNEAFEYWRSDFADRIAIDWRQGTIDNLPFYQAFANGANSSKGEHGSDYIEMAFRLARKLDPEIKLYYNADKAEDINHIKAVSAMVKDLNSKWKAEGNSGLLVDGVGLQGIFGLDVSLEDVETNIKRLISTGVQVRISEFQIGIYGPSNPPPSTNSDGKLKPTPELLHRQAIKYANFMNLFKKYSKDIDCVNINGIEDSLAWIRYSYPLLLNPDYSPKPAYFAVFDPDGYLAGKYDTEEKRQEWVKENIE